MTILNSKQPKVKAVPYLKAVMHFAIAHQLKFFTWKDQQNAIELYESNAAVKN